MRSQLKQEAQEARCTDYHEQAHRGEQSARLTWGPASSGTEVERGSSADFWKTGVAT